MVRYLIASRVPIADVLFIAALLQGIDYLLRPAESTALLNAVEAAVPIWAWGGVFAGAGALGFVALRRKLWPLAGICHAALFGVYGGVGAGIVISVVQLHQYWGWGAAVLWWVAAAGHALFGLIDVWREDLYRRLGPVR